MLEKEIEARLVKKVAAGGGRAYKFTSPGNAGVPDRLVVLPGGQIHFVELKRPGGKPTALQRMQIDRLSNLGCSVWVLDSPAVVDQFIKEVLP